MNTIIWNGEEITVDGNNSGEFVEDPTHPFGRRTLGSILREQSTRGN